MCRCLVAYISTLVIFLSIDAVWLGVVAKDFYFSQVGHLMLDEVNYAIALGFYCMYVVGIVMFAILPALQSGEWKRALAYGAFFGFFTYATYDLTNLATLKDWPVVMSIMDMAWGVVITSVSATLGYFVTRKIVKPS